MKTLYETCAKLLSYGEDVVIATIMSKRGSAPRGAGAKMMVRRDGTQFGTIGGGLLESKVLSQLNEIFQTEHAVVEKYDLAGADAHSMDMICGGRVEVFVDFISAKSSVNAEIFRGIQRELQSGQTSVLVTELLDNEADSAVQNKCLLTQGHQQIGLSIPRITAETLLEKASAGPAQLVEIKGRRYMVESIASPATLFLFGSGHVSYYVAGLSSLLDFRTVVVDDRPELVIPERFPAADELMTPGSFENCFKDLSISDDSYIVIVTREHRSDRVVLAQALATNASYIGLISSQRKRHLIYQALRESGVTDEQLARVHSPIGLPIDAETPQEIAVSIAAELIAVRGQRVHAQS